MKKILLALVGVLLFGLAAVLVAPSFVDWNEHKARIAEEVAAATGERIAIDGDISLALLPTPRLSAAGVRLAGAEGQADRLTLTSLDLRVALAPLLGGEIEVVSLVMIEPRLLYEIDPEGNGNWSFGPSDAATSTGGPAPQEADVGLKVRSLKIADGVLIYRDRRSGEERRIENLQADLSADSLAGPFRLGGSFDYAGQGIEVAATSGRIDRPEGASSTLTLTAAGLGNAKLAWEGSLVPEAPAASGRLSLSGDSLRALSDLIGESGSALPPIETDYDVTAQLNYKEESLTLEDATLRFGNSSLSAAGMASFGAAPELRLEVAASRIDLDEVLASIEPAVGQTETDDQVDAGSDEAVAEFALPADVTARIDLTAETVLYRGGTLRQVEFRGSLRGGEALVEILGATLPGEAEVFLSGRVAAPPDGLGFDGGLELRANDLRQTLAWFGQEVEGIADDRLRRLILVTDVSAKMAEGGERLDLNNVTADLDASRLRGGLAVRLGARPGIGIGLSVDRLNLDAYMPASLAEDETTTQESGSDGEASPEAAALAVLDSFDANFDLHAEQMVVRGEALQEVRARGSLLSGDVNFTELSVDAFPGGRGELSGRVVGLSGTPKLEEGRFDIALQEPARLLRYLGRPGDEVVSRLGPLAARGDVSGDLDTLGLSSDFTGLGGSGRLTAVLRGLEGAPEVEAGSLSLNGMEGASLAAVLGMPATHPLAQLGAFDLDLQANGSQSAVSYDLELVALGGRLRSDGRLTDYLQDSPGLDGVSLAIEGIEAVRLARLAGLPETETLQRLGPVGLTSTMSGSLQQLTYGTRVAVLGTELRAQGTAENLPSGLPDFAFDLDVRSDDLQRVLQALFPDQPVGRPGALTLAANISGSPLRMSVAGLQGQAGRTTLQGDISLDLTAARPRLDTTLAFGDLVLADFLPGQDTGGGQGGGQAASDSAGWSREPLPLDPLRQFDGQIDASFASLDTGDLRLDEAVLSVRLDGGVATVERFDSRLAGGTLAANGTIDAADSASGAKTDLDLRLDRVALGPLLQSAGVEHQVQGVIDMNGRFTASGSSELELVSTLNGNGSAAGELSFQPGGLEQGANLVAGLLGAAVQQVQGFTDPVNALFGAFGQAPVALSLTYRADRGVLRSDDILLQGQGARLDGQGVMVDLPRGTTALDLAVTLAGDTEPYITVALGGPLESPNTSFGGNILRRGLNLGTSGDAPSSPQDLIEGIIGGALGVPTQQDTQPQGEPAEQLPSEEEPAPEQQPEPDPREQILRGIFRGILTPQ